MERPSVLTVCPNGTKIITSYHYEDDCRLYIETADCVPPCLTQLCQVQEVYAMDDCPHYQILSEPWKGFAVAGGVLGGLAFAVALGVLLYVFRAPLWARLEEAGQFLRNRRRSTASEDEEGLLNDGGSDSSPSPIFRIAGLAPQEGARSNSTLSSQDTVEVDPEPGVSAGAGGGGSGGPPEGPPSTKWWKKRFFRR